MSIARTKSLPPTYKEPLPLSLYLIAPTPDPNPCNTLMSLLDGVSQSLSITLEHPSNILLLEIILTARTPIQKLLTTLEQAGFQIPIEVEILQ